MSLPRITFLFSILLCLILTNIQPAFSDTYSNNASPQVTSPENSLPQDTLTVSTDKSLYTDGDKILVSGLVGYTVPGFPVIVRIQTPNGNLLSTQQVTVSSDGTYSKFINAGGNSWSQEGTYTIFAQYGVKNISAHTTFDFKKSMPQVTQQPQTYPQPTTTGQPSTYQQPQTPPSQIPQPSNPEPPMIDLSGNNLFIIIGAVIAVIAGLVINFVSKSSRKRAARESMLQWKRENMMRDDRESRQREERESSPRNEKNSKERDEREAREKADREDRERAEREAMLRYEREAMLRAEQGRKERAEREAMLRAEQETSGRFERDDMRRAERESRERSERQAKERSESEARERYERESRKQYEREQFIDDPHVKGTDWAYRKLGLSRTCSCEEVKSASRELIKKYNSSLGSIHRSSDEQEAADSKMRDILKAREMINKEKGCS